MMTTMLMGRDCVSELLSPNHGGMISTVENSSFVNQSSLAILPAEPSRNKAGGTGEEYGGFGLTKYFISHFEGFF
jgi:hypothetical protein